MCWRHVHDASEVPCTRELVQYERVILGGFIGLLLPLFWDTASGLDPVTLRVTLLGTGRSWNFSWGRPCLHLVLAFIGLFHDYHPAARISCLLGLAQAIFFDTLSSYDISTQIECIKSGRCALPEGYSLQDLKLLKARDHASVLFSVWALLLLCYLSLVMGACRTRYSFHQLHAGSHNRTEIMRVELAKVERSNRRGQRSRE